MRKFKRRQRHGLPFGLFLAVVGALLLPAAVAPRANAGSTDYRDSEYPTLALNGAPDGQPGGFQPFQVEALFSWAGVTQQDMDNSTNWSPAGPPGASDTAVFNSVFISQPNLTVGDTVGTLSMTTGVVQNVV